MRRLRNILVAVTIVVATSAGAGLAADVWSWYVDAEGEASGSLASLQALRVSDAKGGDNLYPGQTMPIRVDISNENPVPLTLATVEISDLRSGDQACDASLQDSRLRFDRTPDIIVHPGANDGIVLGSVKLPRLLAQSCQGKDISAGVNVRAAYGASA